MTFAIPAELTGDYSFTPGQYLTLRTTMDGEEIRRSYSICSGPDDGELRIAVKKVDGGAFSSWAADELKAGDQLDVMTPTGRFGIAHAPGEARIYVGFAAGSGITPVLSIVKGVLAREPDSRFFLFYGNRSTGGMLFREALEELKDRFLQRFSVFHVISGEEQDIPILHGRLDGEKVRVLLQASETRIPALPDVPTMVELATTPEAREVLRFWSLKYSMAYPIFLPPDVPAERVKAIRDAFDATMKDPLFLAEAKKLGLDIDPFSGEQIHKLIEEIQSAPQELVDRVAKLMQPPGERR